MAVLLPNGKQQYDAANGVPAVGYQLFTYDVGTTNPRTTWSNEGQSAANTNPIILDARGEAVIFWSGDYTVTLKDNLGSTIWSVDGVNSSAASLLDNYVVDTGAANAYIANGISTTVLVAGLKVAVKIANNNTGVSTLNYGGLGIKSIITNGSALHGGELKAGVIYIFEYDGTNFQLLNPSNGATAVEIAAGVVPSNINYPPGDIRRYGAVTSPLADGSDTVDNSAAIQSAANIPNVPIYIPSGNWQYKNLTTPNNKKWIGDGLHQSNLISKIGSTGIMFTDQGNAAKVDISGISFYGNNCAYTAGFNLGNNAATFSGGIAFGTEGVIDNVVVRDLPAGFPGFDIKHNVGQLGFISVQNTGGIRILGTGGQFDKIENVGALSFTNAATAVVCTDLGDMGINQLHVEAPVTGTIPVYLSANASLDKLVVSLAASTTYSHLIEIGAAATTWNVRALQLYFPAGTAPVITNGNFKSGSEYFGGNASSKSHAGEQNYSSETFNAGPRLAINKGYFQAFTIRIQNVAGTVKHSIGQVGSVGVAGTFEAQIPSANVALTTTPTGADGSTPFAAGGKIGSASTNFFIFDTAAQIAADSTVFADITFNSSTVQYNLAGSIQLINVNGVTVPRPVISLTNPTTGAAVAWATALGTAGWIIDVAILAFLR